MLVGADEARTVESGLGVAAAGAQIVEALVVRLLLFAVLWIFTRRPRPMGAASGLFLIGYGVCRFAAEYAREPDAFLGYLALGLTMGQWLSLPMIVAGAIMMSWVPARRQAAADGARPDEEGLKPRRAATRSGDIRRRARRRACVDADTRRARAPR